ncbi:2, 3-dihydroxybenzoic acid decarboxylase [Colletotrichum karsti]|uniref:2, 3-dihydroxybenzoic acid decarboxylase n=1 Tax=Colletotrichum karsti TaxID=1095194 RepID=A0A9P6IFX5_9PEZI|nr:2, 3-dihydroxybenzoic acid decarboxylase [Colletotrichum karsti]KAF9878005.1 2, 3-dihydroxybenzoic acid decarboxylase [Colletotrichum karsti]
MARFITIEEHYLSPLLPEEKVRYNRPSVKDFGTAVIDKLGDLGPARLEAMANDSVAMTVLSHLPATPEPSVCTAVNNDLYSKIEKHPDQYAAFALLPLEDPEAAAEELRRCVKDLGFVGALTGNHLDDGSFFDTPQYYPLWEAAQELEVPIYIHPTFADESEMKVNFEGPYDIEIAKALSAWGWGWHSRTSLHFLRLFAAGTFDRFPKLKIILGHMGEMLPFMLDRIVRSSSKWPPSDFRKRGLREVWDNNVWVTTSGMFSLAPMACLLQETKSERVIFSIDYPFSTNDMGREFMEKLKGSGLVNDEEWEGIAWKNVKNLLRLKFEPPKSNKRRANSDIER